MKKELEKASIEDLLEAIKSKGHKLYIGIIDYDGMESLMNVENFEKFQDLYGSLSVRARFNGHRNPQVFSVIIPSEMYEIFNSDLLKGKFKDVAESVRELSTFKVIG